MLYILYIIDADGLGYHMRKFVKRQRELRGVASYWAVPIAAALKENDNA